MSIPVLFVNNGTRRSQLAIYNESMIALKDDKMINVVVPYPMGFYAKTFDGRIDDANAGWKGRGVWAAPATARRSMAKASARATCRSW